MLKIPYAKGDKATCYSYRALAPQQEKPEPQLEEPTVSKTIQCRPKEEKRADSTFISDLPHMLISGPIPKTLEFWTLL